MYIELLKKTILDSIYSPHPNTEDGNYLPERAVSSLGFKRMNNIQQCIESIIRDKIPGDFIECGVWRGGACIFMNGILQYYNQTKKEPLRKVYVADSFGGFPAPEPQYPADKGSILHTIPRLTTKVETVLENFEKFDLLTENVEFIKGFFSETLPGKIGELALLRLDGDMYSSTIQCLRALYDKLVSGGYIIIDDFGAISVCKQAVFDFRKERNITEPIIDIDWTGVYWRKK